MTCTKNIPASNPDTDYNDNGDGTVTHIPTGLVWKICSEGQTAVGGTCAGTASSNYTWAQALELASTSNFAGKTDWRLPNIRELNSLVEECRHSPSINDTIFPATTSVEFWSGSPNAYNPGNISGNAWKVSFYGGYTGNSSRDSNSNAVRLVRGGLPTSNPAPICTLSASPAGITTGGSSTLTANCNPAATSYTWTGGTCSGMTSATCTVTPTTTTSYTVAGTNTGGTGAAVSATVTVNSTTCNPTLATASASAGAAASTGSVSVASTCAWTATSNASWITITSGASGSGNGIVSYSVAANTGTTARTGTLTIAGQTFTVTQAGATVSVPVCTLSANPGSITAGGSSTLTANCGPTASSYTWTGGTCAVTTGATCTVSPTTTMTYSVAGTNSGGTGATVSATVTVTANTTSYTVPGTLGNDVFVLTAGNYYYGGGGNDTYIISPNTLRSGVTAKIVDSEGDNLIQLVDGMTVTASSFFSDAAQLTLSNGAKVNILGASKFKFQLGANAPKGDTAAVLSYADFVTSLGASLSGTLPASGTAGYVVPTGFTQATAPVPSVAGSSYTVPGTLDDDVLAPSGGNSYLGGGGNDVYIISPYTLSGAVTAKIIDSEGANVIQLVKGLTIASSSFFNNAVQLMLSNGAIVQILGASGFSYQLGANAPAGVTASSLSYAQFAAALGASVPAAGASAVSGSANFVVPSSGQ